MEVEAAMWTSGRRQGKCARCSPAVAQSRRQGDDANRPTQPDVTTETDRERETDRDRQRETHIHACMHACIHTYIHTYIHSHPQTYIHTYMHAYIHTYIQDRTGQNRTRRDSWRRSETERYTATHRRTRRHTHRHTHTNLLHRLNFGRAPHRVLCSDSKFHRLRTRDAEPRSVLPQGTRRRSPTSRRCNKWRKETCGSSVVKSPLAPLSCIGRTDWREAIPPCSPRTPVSQRV